MEQFNLGVTKKLFLVIHLAFFSTIVLAQSGTFEGKVVDAVTKVPLEGVSVSIKNSRKGTSTNKNGEFSLQAPAQSKIVLSFVGYDPKEIISSEDDPTIELSASAQQLTNVVVTALGVRKDSKKIGYSIQEVKGEDLIKARDQNPITGLHGKSSGIICRPFCGIVT